MKKKQKGVFLWNTLYCESYALVITQPSHIDSALQ